MMKKNTYNAYSSFVLLIVVFAICLSSLSSVLIDPYNVIGLTHFNKKNFEPNTRYLKIEHLLHNNEHNGFILGASRVNFYDVKSAKMLSNYNYYNMTTASDNSIGVRRKLDWLLKNKNIDQVIWGLDYDESRRLDSLDLLRQDHPLVTSDSKLTFYSKYILSFQPNTLITCIKDNLKDEYDYVFDIFTGQFKLPKNDFLMNKNSELYIANNFKPAPKVKLMNQSTIENIEQVVNAIDKKKIRRIIIINPYNQHLFLSFNIQDYLKWLRKIVDIVGEVWDFSGLNLITKNDKFYYENSHFVKHVGDLVLSRVFDSKVLGETLPNDFGVLVNKDNINSHLKQLYEEYMERQHLP